MSLPERRWSFINPEQTGLPDAQRALPVMIIDKAKRVVQDGNRPVAVSSDVAWAVLLVLAERLRDPTKSPFVSSAELKSVVRGLGYYGLDLAGESVTRLRQLMGNSGRTEELVIRVDEAYRLQRQVVFVGEEPNQQIAEKEGGQVITAGKTTQEPTAVVLQHTRKNYGNALLEEDPSSVCPAEDVFDKEPDDEDLRVIEEATIADSLGVNPNVSFAPLPDKLYTIVLDQLARDSAESYLYTIGRIPLLTAEQEVQLAKVIKEGTLALQRLQNEQGIGHAERTILQAVVLEGKAARCAFIEANLRLVASIAKRYTGRGLPLDDLVQEGFFGLERAVEKFDHTRGFKFSTYATWWIRQAIRRAIYDKARIIRIPIHVREKLNELGRIRDRLCQELGREPSDKKLAIEAGLPTEKVREYLTAAGEIWSLDQPVGEDEEYTLGDLIASDGLRGEPPDPSELAYQAKLTNAIRQLLQELTERERKVIRLRYGLEDGRERTLEEVGEEFGLTRERTRQILQKTLGKLREKLRADGNKELRSYHDEG